MVNRRGGWWSERGGGGPGGIGVVGGPMVVTQFAIPQPAPNPKIKPKILRGGGWMSTPSTPKGGAKIKFSPIIFGRAAVFIPSAFFIVIY